MKRFLLLSVLFAAVFCTCCTEDAAPIFGDVYGTITDSKTGEPVRNAEVILSPTNATTISGSDGHFEFRSLEAGQYKISVSSDGYEGNSRQITVVPGKSTACDMHLTPKAVVEIFNVDPLTLNFGTTQTQMAVTVTNSSARDTQWSLDLGQNTWLKASPIAGQIGAGKSQTIVFSANRAYLTKEVSGIVSVSALGGSSPLTVNCSPSLQASATMEVMPLDVDFGERSKEQTIRIKNTGGSPLNWTIFGIDEEVLTLSNTSGTIQPEAAQVVVIKLDRSKIDGNFVTSFTLSDGTNDQQVNVNVGLREGNAGEEPDNGTIIEPADRTIFYTTTNDNIVVLDESQFDANILSNTYEDGVGTITFDGNIQSLGDKAFYGRTTLKTITLPNSVTDIGYQSFEGCTELININMSNVESIGWQAFVDCIKLREFHGQYVTDDHKGLVVNNTLIKVVPSITTFVVPDDVTSIGLGAFEYCSGLTSVTIPNSVTEIGGSAFRFCSSLMSIIIPDSVIRIGSHAFTECSSLTSITIPNSVTVIEGDTFQKCSNLKSIVIPNSVTKIDDAAFRDCSSLTSITIPEGVSVINSWTFAGCSSLTYITIPNNVTMIDGRAFDNCSGLTSVSIPDNVTTIGVYAFHACSSLTSITIPNSVIEIGLKAFYKCSKLYDIRCMPTVPPTLDNDAFTGIAENYKIYVPTASENAYKQADKWSEHADQIVGYDF